MALKKTEYKDFVYVWYHRQDFRDSVTLKRALGDLQLSAGEQRDVVVDCAACNGLISAELTALVRMLNSLRGTPRFLRLVVNPRIASAIEAVNLHRQENLVMYKDQKSFIEAVKRAGAAVQG